MPYDQATEYFYVCIYYVFFITVFLCIYFSQNISCSGRKKSIFNSVHCSATVSSHWILGKSKPMLLRSAFMVFLVALQGDYVMCDVVIQWFTMDCDNRCTIMII